jgi:hypothetical protein
MSKLARLQVVGPLVLLSAVLAAELAAYALAVTPSSAFLWYLNFEVFSLFRKSRATLQDYGNIPFVQVLFIAGPTALIGLAGLMLKRNLLLAISSNVSLVFAAFLVYNWYSWSNIAQVHAASLLWVHVPTGNTLCLFVTLALTCLASFFASHIIYFRSLRADI